VTGLYALEVGSALSYVMAVLVPALDALVPVLPSETVVIALGVATAGSADPRIGLLVALAAFGAFLGDNAAYLVGRRFGSAVDRRLFAGERGARRRAWAQRSLDRFGTRGGQRAHRGSAARLAMARQRAPSHPAGAAGRPAAAGRPPSRLGGSARC
jgi:hypothetical protein